MKAENLKLLIHAGNPIISLETPDESRAIRLGAGSGPSGQALR